MPQLVGSNCIVCQQRIQAINEGRFCQSCGNPIHNHCLKTAPKGISEGTCSICGGDLLNPVSVTFRREQERKAKAAQENKYPISKACPACGDIKFNRVKPSTWVAFASDRICKDCGTRYTPPTPRWASFVFVIAGLALMAGSIILLGILGLPLVFAGAIAIAFGVRSFFK